MRTVGQTATFIYSGLDVSLQITSVDPLEQIYYAGSDSFIPDRSLTPLVLVPKMQAKDKSGKEMPSELASSAWYLGSVNEKNRITSRNQTDEFYLSGLNLVVRKNLETPVQIYYVGEYLDPRTKTVISIPEVVQLSIRKSSEIAPAPTISIDRPVDWTINPLNNVAIQNLSATIFKNEKALQGAVKWNKTFNGIKSEIVEDDDFYISGQLTNSLKIDTDKLPSEVLIGCENPDKDFYNKVYGINDKIEGVPLDKLNYSNLISNGIFNLGTNNWVLLGNANNLIVKDNILSFSSISSDGWKGVGTLPTLNYNVGDKIYLYVSAFSSISVIGDPNAQMGIVDFENNDLYAVVNIDLKDNEWIDQSAIVFDKEHSSRKAYFRYRTGTGIGDFKLRKVIAINLTQTFGKGNEPTQEQLDSVFKNMPYIPSPEDYAPNGIIQGEYSTDVPMFVKYPDTLDISMKPLPLIPEGVEQVTLEADVTTSAGTLNNPAEYLDIDYYIESQEAGSTRLKVGSGNSTQVTREQLVERPKCYLEWEFKPRPTTLVKRSKSIYKLD